MEAKLLSSIKHVTDSARSSDVDSTCYRQVYKILLLLGSLHRGPLYGYELYHMTREYNGIKTRRFYAILDRLVADRCLYYEIVPGSGSGRGRRIYALTHEGYQQFSALLRALLLTDTASPGEVEIALDFLDRLPEAEVLTLLRARYCCLINQRQQALAKLTGQASAGIPNHGINHRIYLLDAELDWIDHMVVALQKTSVSA